MDAVFQLPDFKRIILVCMNEFPDTMCPDSPGIIYILKIFLIERENVLDGKPMIREIKGEEVRELYKEIVKNKMLSKTEKIDLWRYMKMSNDEWCYDHWCSTKTCEEEEHKIPVF